LKSLKKTTKNPSISKKKSPYGDGNSAKKIIHHLKNNL
jgi:UDP-N-acetylglucosamine 2-epimerase